MTNKAKNDSVEYSLHRPAGQVHLTGDYVSISRATQFCSICPTFLRAYHCSVVHSFSCQGVLLSDGGTMIGTVQSSKDSAVA